MGRVNEMKTIELPKLNPARREQKLRQLKQSVMTHRYQMDPDRIAVGLLREAWLDAVSRRAEK